MSRRRRAAAVPERNVRVYTVNDESRFVVVGNIPAIGGILDELIGRLGLYGAIRQHRLLPTKTTTATTTTPTDRDADAFTQSLWVEYETINNARHAKARAGRKPFYGSLLRVSYVPRDEAPEDTAAKLRERRELLVRRATRPPPPRPRSDPMPAQPPGPLPRTTLHGRMPSLPEVVPTQTPTAEVAFIGPQLPPAPTRLPTPLPPPPPPSQSANPMIMPNKRRRRI